ncbi:hypothetical protein BHT95_16200 [Bacillus paralicheniformis]|nr:hypothetical protein BHT95_16200 [Bacillus paralicheniformis]TWM21399.1 hypothetical protein CHCC14821_0818 [Bacillus paralicheniformis]TWM60989.1 hypothetical protein CHCC14814_0532 [Bacillus paralicheniformis]
MLFHDSKGELSLRQPAVPIETKDFDHLPALFSHNSRCGLRNAAAARALVQSQFSFEYQKTQPINDFKVLKVYSAIVMRPLQRFLLF